MPHRDSPWTWLFAALLLVGCSTPAPDARHIIAFDARGHAAELRLSPLPLPRATFEAKPPDASRSSTEGPFPDVVDGLEVFLNTWSKENPNKPPRVLIFIHGGLNTYDDTVGRIKKLSGDMRKDGIYPIYLAWDSSLPESFGGSLTGWSGAPVWWSWLFVPVNLIQDISRGLTRAPLAFWSDVRSTFPIGDLDPEAPFAMDTAMELAARSASECEGVESCELPAPNVSVGRSLPDGNAIGTLWSYVLLPARILPSIGIEAAGAPTWVELRRRVAVIFNPDEQFLTQPNAPGENPGCEELDCPKPSALVHFLGELDELQRRRHFEVILIGHSMGGIVVDRILEADLRGRAVPDLQHVVYLASANSVRENLRSSIPYLGAHDETEIYHVTLHPDAETSERAVDYTVFGVHALDVVLPGTLLVWLDDFMGEPEKQLDRTAGRAVNLMHGYRYTPLCVRPRIFIKVLPAGPNLMETRALPQRHGDFSDPRTRYWETDFYAPVCPSCGANSVLWMVEPGEPR